VKAVIVVDRCKVRGSPGIVRTKTENHNPQFPVNPFGNMEITGEGALSNQLQGEKNTALLAES
jgi:hypothetical protein